MLKLGESLSQIHGKTCHHKQLGILSYSQSWQPEASLNVYTMKEMKETFF